MYICHNQKDFLSQKTRLWFKNWFWDLKREFIASLWFENQFYDLKCGFTASLWFKIWFCDLKCGFIDLENESVIFETRFPNLVNQFNDLKISL